MDAAGGLRALRGRREGPNILHFFAQKLQQKLRKQGTRRKGFNREDLQRIKGSINSRHSSQILHPRQFL
jgi:hypothetical protein